MCDYSYAMTANLPDAENIVQDVFVNLWNNRGILNISGSVRSYLFSATRNGTLNLLKHKAIEKKHSAAVIAMIDDLNKYGSYEEDQLRIEKIKEILNTLPPQCKKVFTLNCLEGKKYKEIAEELGISLNTVKEHITKAYKEIRTRALK